MMQLENMNTGRRTFALINIALLTFMATLDGSIVNVALPRMATSLSTDTGTIAWVVTSYLLAIAGSILLFGKIGDSLGMRRIFLAGVAVFSLGSLLCGLAGSLALLVLARVLQGIGAAAAMATNQGLVAMIFPAEERGKALGIMGSFVALGTLSGPPLGGFITEALSWHYIFLINVPVGIFVLAAGLRIIPRVNTPSRARQDVTGAALFALSMTALFGALILGGERGYRDPLILGGFATFLVTFTAFILRERKVANPLLDLRIFRNGAFSLGLACAFLSYLALAASNLVLPFYLQGPLGLSPARAGMVMVSYPLVLAVIAPLSGRLSDRIGTDLLTLAGLSLTTAGLFFMCFQEAGSPLWTVILAISVMAAGNGLFQSPNTALIMSRVPRSAMGVAGSLNAFIRNFGLVSGVSAAVPLLYGLMGTRLGRPVFSLEPGTDEAFLWAMRGVYLAAGSLHAIGVFLTAGRMYRSRRMTAEPEFSRGE